MNKGIKVLIISETFQNKIKIQSVVQEVVLFAVFRLQLKSIQISTLIR